MGWSISICGPKGGEARMPRDERDLWESARKQLVEKYGAAPLLFEKGYAHLSGVYTELYEAGFALHEADLDATQVKDIAKTLRLDREKNLSGKPDDRHYYYDVGLLFFEAAAAYDRAVSGGL